MQFSELIITLEGLQQQLSHQAVADLLMTLRNWLIGFYIVEYELFKNFYLTYPNILQFLTEKY